MTDRIALYIGALIVIAILADLLLAGGGNLHFLAKKGLEFIEWIAFWR